MAKANRWKTKEPYTYVQFRLKVRDRNRLKVLCAELGITIQGFMLRLLRNSFPEITHSENPEPRSLKKYREMIGKQEVAEITQEDDETLA